MNSAEWHAKREDHYADGEQMQIDCAARTTLRDRPAASNPGSARALKGMGENGSP